MLGAIAGIAIVLLATWIAYQLGLNLATTGFIQLLIILAVALRAGFVQATLASIIANCCLNYFFVPPVFTFTIADPQNWIAVGVFEVSALVVSRLSTEAQAQAARASSREAHLRRLYEVSRELLLLTREKPPAQEVLLLIQRVFAIDAAVLFDASQATAELVGPHAAGLENDTRAAYLQDRDSQMADGRTWIRVLRLGVRPIGALALQGSELTGITANALASLTAIALERAHSFERESRAEAKRQSEQLRTVVLDALAHEYKTPLTVVRTATTGLIEMGQLSAVQTELISLVDSETNKLSELTTRLLQMSRLDKTDVRLRPERIDVDELIETVVSRAAQLLSAHIVHLQGTDSGASIQADRELIVMALTQFLDNAAKYSGPCSAITVGVVVLAGEVRISVHNVGPYIPPEERERIFRRFYRSSGASYKAAGTGIGLSITKKVADVHQGRTWVTSEEDRGNTFFLALPRSKKD